MSWYAGFEEICQPDAPLTEHTWYRIGGPARWLFCPQSEEQLVELMLRCERESIRWRVLGHGANVLVRDEGFDGAVIKLNAPAFQFICWNQAMVHASGGADFTKLVRESVDRGLSGLEGLAGIPGSVGGVVCMNAGGKYGNVSTAIVALRLLDRDGEIRTRSSLEIDFGYRHTELNGAVVLAATFALQVVDIDDVRREYRRVWMEKSAAQPAMAHRSAGCVFKNPPGYSAGALIDQAGLKGERRGGAEISTRHANFIVAHPGARACDVLELIDLAKDRVRQAHGLELELEVDVW